MEEFARASERYGKWEGRGSELRNGEGRGGMVSLRGELMNSLWVCPSFSRTR